MTDSAPGRRDLPAPIRRPVSIAEALLESGRHPVIVFGGVASGKTMMLVSLIEALNRSASVDVHLGDPILPRGDPRSHQMHQWARYYFESHSQSMARGELLPTTQIDSPTFIPIDIVQINNPAPVRLALLEGRGEWYMPVVGSPATTFRDFMPDLADVIEKYPDGLSVIWMAPSCLFELDEGTEESDFALVGALAEYRRRRGRAMSLDSHLFLLAKWDCLSSPLTGENFGTVEDDIVRSTLDARYPNAWPRYQGLALGSAGQRFFMQYVSAYVVENLVRFPPARHRASFDRYPRTLLNWLYGNATETETAGMRGRSVLFADVLRRPPPRATVIDRVLRFLLRR